MISWPLSILFCGVIVDNIQPNLDLMEMAFLDKFLKFLLLIWRLFCVGSFWSKP